MGEEVNNANGGIFLPTDNLSSYMQGFRSVLLPRQLHTLHERASKASHNDSDYLATRHKWLVVAPTVSRVLRKSTSLMGQ